MAVAMSLGRSSGRKWPHGHAPSRATFERTEGSYAVYSVPAGELTFTSRGP